MIDIEESITISTSNENQITSQQTTLSSEHKITIPGYGFGLASGIVTVITTALLYYLIFHATPLASFLKDTFFEMYVFTVFFLIGNLVCAIIMIAASFMIRHEENALAGSILILIISAIGMVFSIGLWIGPILGIISGMLGLKEHHQLMKTHHRMIHEHDRVIGLCHNLIEEHYALMNAHKKLMRKRSR